MIRVDKLEKYFRIYDRPSARLKEVFTLGRRTYHKKFTALKDIDLVVEPGETVGIIGQNGSGKSTLLKILAGLMVPSSGTVQVEGRVASLIELGTGFHPEFTGLANIRLTAGLMGLNQEEIDNRIPQILTFSGLQAFINRPIKTYSSGMWVRLAFSVAMAVEPEIFLVDEALAVGDLLFQRKCIAKLQDFQRAGVSIVFISHDLGAIKTLCSRALLLEEGRKIGEGSPEAMCSEYISRLAEKASQQSLENRVEARHRRYGNYQAKIETAHLLDEKGRPTKTLVSGQSCQISIHVSIRQEVRQPSVGILIRDRLANDIFGTNTHLAGIEISERWRDFAVTFRLEMDIGAGNYYMAVAVHSGEDHLGDCYDWIDNAIVFTVLPCEPKFTGYARLRPQISAEPVENLKRTMEK